MPGKDDIVVLSGFSRLMTEKLEEPISHVRGWVNGEITIAVVRSYSRMICGSLLLGPLWDRYTGWDLGLGLDLAQ